MNQRLTIRGREYRTKELNRLREIEDMIEDGVLVQVDGNERYVADHMNKWLECHKVGFNEGVTAMLTRMSEIAKELTEDKQ